MAFGNKNSTPSFALTLPMKVTKQDEIFLSKKFRISAQPRYSNGQVSTGGSQMRH